MFSWGGFVTHPKRPSFMCGEFLLHTLYWLLFMQGVVLHIPCWHLFFFFFWTGKFLLHIPCLFLFFFYSGEFLLHNPCWLHFYAGSFSYTSRAASFLSVEFLLHIPCWHCFYVGSFSYTSHVFMWGVSLTHPTMTSILSTFFSFFFFLLNLGKCLLYIPCLFLFSFFLGSFYYTSCAGFILSGEFLLHIPCWLNLYFGSFSYTSHTGFIFLWGVSLTHPMLALIISGDFLLYIPCWLYCCVANFSYTSHATFIFVPGVCLTHPVLPSFLCG